MIWCSDFQDLPSTSVKKQLKLTLNNLVSVIWFRLAFLKPICPHNLTRYDTYSHPDASTCKTTLNTLHREFNFKSGNKK